MQTKSQHTVPIYPLFKRFPVLKSRLPLLSIGSFPTPVERLDKISPGLWVKRDDLTSPEYGGNKVRKLELILGDVQARKKQRIVTMGSIGTNHGLAVAYYARRLNISCTLLLFHQPLTPHVRRQLLLFKAFGAEMQYYRRVLSAGLAFYTTCRIRYPKAYFLYAGGSTPLGTLGYVNAAMELAQQIHNKMLPTPDVIFCPFGSGGTLAGLALGLRLCRLQTRLVGIQVTPPRLGPFPAINKGTVSRHMQATFRLLKHCSAQVPDVKLTAPEIDLRYLGDGYGYATKAGNAAMETARKYTSLVLDDTYTAKTFAAVLDYCRENTDNTVLYWHTLSAAALSTYANKALPGDLSPALQSLFSEVPKASTKPHSHEGKR